jgi:hypothetical protein
MAPGYRFVAQERHEIGQVALPIIEQMIYMRGVAVGNHDDPTVFEAITRQMVETLAQELREIRRRVDGLLWMGAGAILVDTVLRVAGIT